MEPTLCMSLKTGVKISALLDLLLAVGLAAASGGSLYFFEKNQDEVLEMIATAPEEMKLFLELNNLGVTWIRIILIFSLVFWVQKVYLGYVLFRAGIEENPRRCRVWLFWTMGLLALSVMFFLASILAMVTLPMAIPIYCGMFIVRGYSIWIVGRFTQSIGEGKTTLLGHDGNDITTL